MEKVIAFVLFIIGVEIILKPRLDWTREKKLLLWYGRKNRDYIVLIE